VHGRVLDKRAFDLDLVKGKSPQIAERAARLAEVVKRDVWPSLCSSCSFSIVPAVRRSNNGSPISICNLAGSSLEVASAFFTSLTKSALSSCNGETLTQTRMSPDHCAASIQAWLNTQRPISRIAPERSAMGRKSSGLISPLTG